MVSSLNCRKNVSKMYFILELVWEKVQAHKDCGHAIVQERPQRIFMTTIVESLCCQLLAKCLQEYSWIVCSSTSPQMYCPKYSVDSFLIWGRWIWSLQCDSYRRNAKNNNWTCISTLLTWQRHSIQWTGKHSEQVCWRLLVKNSLVWFDQCMMTWKPSSVLVERF